MTTPISPPNPPFRSPYLDSLPTFVRIIEVGLRDGLQNEKKMISLQTKIELLNKLYEAGLRTIEAGAFVSPEWVPQMKETPEMFAYLRENAEKLYPEARLSALVPNMEGKDLQSIVIILKPPSSSLQVLIEPWN